MLFGILAVLAGYGLYKIATDSDDNDRYDDDGYYESSSHQQAQAAERAAQEQQIRAIVDQAMAHAEAAQTDIEAFEKMFESLRISINNSGLLQLDKMPEKRVRHVMHLLVKNPQFLADHSSDDMSVRWVKDYVSFSKATEILLLTNDNTQNLLQAQQTMVDNILQIENIIKDSAELEQKLEQKIAQHEASRRR